MAEQVIVNQSTNERRIYPLDYSPGLLTGVTLQDVTFIYEGDNDVDNPPEIVLQVPATETTPLVYVSVQNLEMGEHRISCIATTSIAELKPEIQLIVKAKW